MATEMALAWSTVESECKLEYSNLSLLNGHLELTPAFLTVTSFSSLDSL